LLELLIYLKSYCSFSLLKAIAKSKEKLIAISYKSLKELLLIIIGRAINKERVIEKKI
jgi:hypothetical protein